MKLYSTIILLSLSLIGLAQNSSTVEVEPDPRLYEIYSSEYLANIKTQNPFLIQRWNFYLDNAFYLTDLVPGKEAANTKTVKIENIEAINILKLEKEQKLNKSWDLPTIYKVQGQEKLLIFYAGKLFNEKLNTHLNRTRP